MNKKRDSRFIKVRCNKCKNEQVIFGKCSTIVRCLVCGNELAYPTGGKSDVRSSILEVLD
ncbi:30S ribosomal protein S27e [Candidatus Woesearchaeota archaeon]|nr:30S ribosomal protein S27e [Candidatus Woesearchaeota archaeon]RLE43728.1 MAG: 30S ribosomal protein S27e [Candidatus Woesearchaeota archaeon]